ncbi:hypothetical protein WN943_029285 [Citrus x changshan-huyou]
MSAMSHTSYISLREHILLGDGDLELAGLTSAVAASQHRAAHSQITNLLPFYTMQILNPSRIAITSRARRN